MSEQNIAVTLPFDVAYVSGTVNGVPYVWTNTVDNQWEAVVEKAADSVYVVELTIINTDGESYIKSLTLYYGGLNLITDRTAADVERWKYLRDKGWAAMTDEERAEWQSPLKGCYNYTDMNRVENAVQYISERLSQAGYRFTPIVKTTWSVHDLPSLEDMERYLGNIKTLRSMLAGYSTTPKAPTIDKNFDFQTANDIEQILLDIDKLLSNRIESWFYVGEIFAGEV